MRKKKCIIYFYNSINNGNFCVIQLEGVDTGDFEAINAAAFLLFTESSKTIFIAVKDDDLPEADETFTFNLTLQVQYLTTSRYPKIPYNSRF